jgi:Na+-translocating ferredoxin:NAD+ oxidoreductase RNF subunit RnfB
MDVIEILRSTAIVAGVGLVFGVLITIAHLKLKVWEDLRIGAVADILPGNNCGACGLAGCRAFAEALIAGKVPPAACTVMGPDDVEEVAGLLGVDAGEAEKCSRHNTVVSRLVRPPLQSLVVGRVVCGVASASTIARWLVTSTRFS